MSTAVNVGNGVRHRGAAKAPASSAADSSDLFEKPKDRVSVKATQPVWDYRIALVVVTLLAFLTRFYGISYPQEVVFDEVHFGKFASYYLKRTYFFDVHPPFGKLLFAFAGWLVGYDGAFTFDNIGDDYIKNKVPYVAYRAMPATLGSLTVSVVYLIMWESGYSLPACLVAAGLVLFDNAHVAQTRLILLDASLILGMALSVYCYVKFNKMRRSPFSAGWWTWLLLTGTALSCTISVKYVGVFTFFSIGVPVLIDLWDLLDINRRPALNMMQFGQHFAARATGLIVFPFLVYLFWFQVHFAVLSKSGPGDEFMTPEFQETLGENMVTFNSVGIKYNDVITMQHLELKYFLHSHPLAYPLRYDDGRISSQGQQVTGYAHVDVNNHWQILPTKPFEDPTKYPVRNGDVVQLRHVVTDTYLLSHDVASPYFPTNQEFTTVGAELAAGERANDTFFEIRIENGRQLQEFRTKASNFKLIHYPSRVAMWTHETPLPEWAYNQAEINGNKNVQQSSNIWVVDELPEVADDDERRAKEPRQIKDMSFAKKWIELQRTMFIQNNALTSSHPYASFPVQWPFLLRGVSFWTNNESREQIYFLGNPIGWWLASSLLAVFAGLIGADQLTLRRGIDALDKRTRSRVYNSMGFFFLTWAAHYFPFYIMGRQLFLHHYLPAHVASTLVTGGLIDFVFNVEPLAVVDVKTPKGKSGPKHVVTKERFANSNLLYAWLACAVILAATIFGFVFFAPLTYGQPGLDVDGILARKWLNYDFHFAK